MKVISVKIDFQLAKSAFNLIFIENNRGHIYQPKFCYAAKSDHESFIHFRMLCMFVYKILFSKFVNILFCVCIKSMEIIKKVKNKCNLFS